MIIFEAPLITVNHLRRVPALMLTSGIFHVIATRQEQNEWRNALKSDDEFSQPESLALQLRRSARGAAATIQRTLQFSSGEVRTLS